MIDAEEEEINNSDLPLDDDQQQTMKLKYRREAQQVISKVNCRKIRGRQVLVGSFRKVNKMIARLQKDKFNFSQDFDLSEDVIRSALFYRPYNMVNADLKYRSSFCKDAVQGNRRLKPPAVQVEEELVNINQKNNRIPMNKAEFSVKIESEPHTSLFYTSKPNSHPLLTIQKPPHFLKYRDNHVLQILSPPCELSIIAVNDAKIQSKCVTIKVGSQGHEAELRNEHMGYAIRPIQSFPFDESAHAGESHSISNYSEQYQQESNNENPPDDSLLNE